jgi:hypothetical protein
LWEAKLVCAHYHSGNLLTNVALGREFEDENISRFHMEPRFTSWSGAGAPNTLRTMVAKPGFDEILFSILGTDAGCTGFAREGQ